MSTEPHSGLRLYNPDWLSDDELVAGFTARLEMLKFLCGELERAPLRGTTHHYLLVGVRGSGKTSMLKRIAVAIRREERLSGHLIGLSFPEELYEVKGLSDFWWASCRALVDALDSSQFRKIADELAHRVEEQEERGPSGDPHDDAGLRLMLDICNQIKRRPVLLVDNLDLVLKRIDKSGRKLKNRQSPAYWALREVLSTPTAPIVIGGSVRLSTPFLGHDDAFYDYFVAQRLIKLSLEEVQTTFDHLACNHGDRDLRDRIHKRPGRLRALYEMTGGNPRALGLVFELLRRGPNSSAVEAFEQLLDLTTPYYKARFEELPEQAQVVLHALALSRRDITKVTYGHRAAVVAKRAGLDTRVVSAQLETLINDGVVEKNKALGGRTQYRVSEQLFRLWLQMRSTRRLRQQVISLTEFLEALFDRYEHQELIRREAEEPQSSSLRSRAMLSLALSELQSEKNRRYALETRAADAVLEAAAREDTQAEGLFAPGDLSEGIEFEARSHLQRCAHWHKAIRPDSERLTRDLLGALRVSQEEKREIIGRLCDRQEAAGEFEHIAPLLGEERQHLRKFLPDAEIDLLYRERASGRLALPPVVPKDFEPTNDAVRSLIWRLLCNGMITHKSDQTANAWISWGKKNFLKAEPTDWAHVANMMIRDSCLDAAGKALDLAFKNGDCLDAWRHLGRLNYLQENWSAAESAFRKASVRDPTDALAWSFLGDALNKLGRKGEAESAYRNSIEIDQNSAFHWTTLGHFLHSQSRYHEAEQACSRAIELDPTLVWAIVQLGDVLRATSRYEEAEAVLRRATEIEPNYHFAWGCLGEVLTKLHRYDSAETAYRKAIEIAPQHGYYWRYLGNFLRSRSRFDEAEIAYRGAVESEPSNAISWIALGAVLEKLARPGEAETAYRRAIDVEPSDVAWWGLGDILRAGSRYDEAEAAYRNAVEYNPQCEMAWICLSSLLEMRSQHDDASAAIRRAIEVAPTSQHGWAYYGILLASWGRNIEAEEAFRTAIERQPADAATWNLLGGLLVFQLRVDEALAAYRKAIEIDPSLASPLVGIGRVLAAKQGRLDEAAVLFSQALELNPEDEEARGLLELVQNRKTLAKVMAACRGSNWVQARLELSALMSIGQKAASWLSHSTFVKEIVRDSLSRGEGPNLLSVFQEVRLDTVALPLVLALDAAIEGGEEKLATVEPEARAAAQLLFNRLTKNSVD